MGDLFTGGIAVIKELGILAFMIFSAIVGLAYLIRQITKNLDRTALVLDKLFDKMDNLCVVLSTHDRQGQNISVDVSEIKAQTTRIDSNVQMLVNREMMTK